MAEVCMPHRSVCETHEQWLEIRRNEATLLVSPSSPTLYLVHRSLFVGSANDQQTMRPNRRQYYPHADLQASLSSASSPLRAHPLGPCHAIAHPHPSGLNFPLSSLLISPECASERRVSVQPSSSPVPLPIPSPRHSAQFLSPTPKPRPRSSPS